MNDILSVYGCICLLVPKFWEGGVTYEWYFISLRLHLPFCPKIFGRWCYLWMIFNQSMTVIWVVSTLIGGPDTWTVTTIIKFIWIFALRCTRDAKTLFSYLFTLSQPCTSMSHLVKLSLPINSGAEMTICVSLDVSTGSGGSEVPCLGGMHREVQCIIDNGHMGPPRDRLTRMRTLPSRNFVCERKQVKSKRIFTTSSFPQG